VARYHGKKGVIYMSLTGTGTAVNIIALNRWRLNSATDKVDVSAFGDVNKVYVQGLPDLTGEISGWWDHTSDDLYDGSRSADGVKLYLYPSSDASGKYWYGPAWVDFSIDVGSAAGVAISGTFVANGAWGQV